MGACLNLDPAQRAPGRFASPPFLAGKSGNYERILPFKIVLAVAAAIVELLAQQRQQRSPTWTQSVGAVSPPVYLLKSAHKMRRLREMCQAEAPEPLRRHGFYAPANYLEFV